MWIDEAPNRPLPPGPRMRKVVSKARPRYRLQGAPSRPRYVTHRLTGMREVVARVASNPSRKRFSTTQSASSPPVPVTITGKSQRVCLCASVPGNTCSPLSGYSSRNPLGQSLRSRWAKSKASLRSLSMRLQRPRRISTSSGVYLGILHDSICPSTGVKRVGKGLRQTRWTRPRTRLYCATACTQQKLRPHELIRATSAVHEKRTLRSPFQKNLNSMSTTMDHSSKARQMC